MGSIHEKNRGRNSCDTAPLRDDGIIVNSAVDPKNKNTRRTCSSSYPIIINL